MIGRAGDVAEHFLRRRHGIGGGQVIHQLGEKILFGGVLEDLRRIIRIVMLRRGRSGRAGSAFFVFCAETPTGSSAARTRARGTCTRIIWI